MLLTVKLSLSGAVAALAHTKAPGGKPDLRRQMSRAPQTKQCRYLLARPLNVPT
jgi:hypothetical protein